jgi:hypothetical protein
MSLHPVQQQQQHLELRRLQSPLVLLLQRHLVQSSDR